MGVAALKSKASLPIRLDNNLSIPQQPPYSCIRIIPRLFVSSPPLPPNDDLLPIVYNPRMVVRRGNNRAVKLPF